VKVALAQINTTVAALEANAAKIKETATLAARRGADLVVFPELAVTGYPPRDFLLSREFIEKTDRVTQDLVGSSEKWAGGAGVVVGTVLAKRNSEGKGLANAVVLMQGGRIVAAYEKALLPSYDVFDETRYFDASGSAGPAEFSGMKIGLTICEDIWNDKDFWREHRLYSRDPVAELAGQGAEILVNSSASPYALGKPKLRESMLGDLAQKYKVPAVMVNMVGGNDSIIFDGGSMAFGGDGGLLARADLFREDLVIVDLATGEGGTRPNPEPEDEEVLQALSLGLKDYVDKCGFKSAVLGLSGGIDSAVTAAVAARALGPRRVHGISMPSRYSSPEGIDDARRLASNLGIHFSTINIMGPFDAITSGLSEQFKGLAPDVTEENIQARIRGTLLMALSNKFGHLVLATGNKSELAAGYCTLYGDMVGGLGVIADIPKTRVYSLARHMNRGGEIIPQRIITRPPTAELKPDQKDEDTLPPYEVLDAILAAYIQDGKSALQIAAMGFDETTVRDVIRRVMNSEYKRRQAPTVLKVTWKAFGEGRRFPVAHGYRPD
jgi:NAD+ synthase (glutamine-hydrolysing)